MKKILIGIVGLIMIVFILLAWQVSQKTPVAKVKNHTIKLYVAKTDKDKEIGLSKYKEIDNSKGMIFSFEKAGYYTFWMKEMKFPIDIIYLNDNKIVTIYQNVKPPKDKRNVSTYQPTKPADKVLEINSGLSQKYNLEIGDTVTFSNI